MFASPKVISLDTLAEEGLEFCPITVLFDPLNPPIFPAYLPMITLLAPVANLPASCPI